MTPPADPTPVNPTTPTPVSPPLAFVPSPPSRPPAAQNAPDPPPHREFLNRELTWLEFNRRVLHEALDPRTPLLERLGFLAIFNSNLDEFYQKRVGGLKRQIQAGITTRTLDGLSPKEQIRAIRDMILPMLRQQAGVYRDTLRPALAEHGVHLLNWRDLSSAERAAAGNYFRDNLFKVLTPLAVDPGHPFPFISNLSTSLGVLLRLPGEAADRRRARSRDAGAVRVERGGAGDGGEEGGLSGELQFARVKVPVVLDRWFKLCTQGADELTPAASAGEGEKAVDVGDVEEQHRFVPLVEVIGHHLPALFEGMELAEVEPFRITRNADVERDEEDAEDLLELIEKELRDRKFARPIRLEVDDSPSQRVNRFLIEELRLHPHDVFEMPGLLDYTSLWQVHKIDKPELKYEPWTPIVPPRLADSDADIFSIIRGGDLMVHHPYESFPASVERFIRSAANDPKVIAIKLTLYRTSIDSPFIPDLIKAAEAGKQVVVLVELKARFDEERNVQLAQVLGEAGIHVVYGLMGLKTHTKTSLVVRHEADGMRAYAHIGTGNYNFKTASLYTDLGLFTCNPQITDDLVQMFHYLTGRSQKKSFDHLLVAPVNMRRRFSEMIDREIALCDAWRERGSDPEDPNRPRIVAKMNSLEDKKLVLKLYTASRAGVRIQLIVRGFCCLRPGVPGLSDNITVTSVIGRFLEHSRIYHFHNDGRGEYYIGSADWMYRNLNNRVECITPIYDAPLRARLKEILDIMLADQRQAWDMHPDGSYTQRTPDPGHKKTAHGTHERLMRLTRKDTGRGK